MYYFFILFLSLSIWTNIVSAPIHKAPRPTLSTPVVGPGSCDLASVKLLLQDIDCRLEECCENVSSVSICCEEILVTLTECCQRLESNFCNPTFITQADVDGTGFVITAPGVYKLQENINYTGAGNAITITTSNVELDLACFALTTITGQQGIVIEPDLTEITIMNGTISGFIQNGIRGSENISRIEIKDVTLTDCGVGIAMLGLENAESALINITSCELISNDTGIQFATINDGIIDNCLLRSHNQTGIDMQDSFLCQIINCTIKNTTASSGNVYGIIVSDGDKNTIDNNIILELVTTSTNLNNEAIGINMTYTFTAISNADLPNFAHGAEVVEVAWSPDNRYLAMGGLDGSGNIQTRVLEFTETTLSQVATFTQGDVNTLAWSPDGRYLAIALSIGLGLRTATVLEFNGTSLVEVASSLPLLINSISWSPDGRFIAVGGFQNLADPDVVVFEFTGTSLIQRAGFNHGGIINSVAWSPDGRFVAIGGLLNVFHVRVLEFTGTDLVQVAGFFNGAVGGIVNSVAWSSNERYLAIGGLTGAGTPEVKVLQFTGTSLTPVATFTFGNNVNSVTWSPDGPPNGPFLAIAGEPIGGIDTQVLIFDGSSLVPFSSFSHGNTVNSLSWSTDARFLALGGLTSDGFEINILSGYQFPSNYFITNNIVAHVQGPLQPAGFPWISTGRGIQASSGDNLISGNTSYNNNVNYMFVAFERFREFLVNIKFRNEFPNRLSNTSFPPL